jgi:hypothetical protein
MRRAAGQNYGGEGESQAQFPAPDYDRVVFVTISQLNRSWEKKPFRNLHIMLDATKVTPRMTLEVARVRLVYPFFVTSRFSPIEGRPTVSHPGRAE